jgi:hypothetical protein
MTRGLLPPDPRSLCPLSSTEFVEQSPPTQKNSWVHVWVYITVDCSVILDKGKLINTWIMEQQKNFLLLRNWVHLVPIFFKLFSHFFMVQLIYSTEFKMVLLFRFFKFSFNYIE